MKRPPKRSRTQTFFAILEAIPAFAVYLAIYCVASWFMWALWLLEKLFLAATHPVAFLASALERRLDDLLNRVRS